MESAATAPHQRRRLPASPVRLVVSIAVLFVMLFLFLRHFLIEPFGVPTGSMAPTLIGNHRATTCPRCGYPVRVGVSNGDEWPASVPCPNCGKSTDLADSHLINGDRVLVDKNVYHLRSPRRWEVAVFICPDDLSKPYVKRVIGLPGETLLIDDGDVYTLDENLPRDRVLLRKSFAEVREAYIPVFDMAYRPRPGGWGPRWLVYPADDDGRLPRTESAPPRPADSATLVDGALILDAADSPQHQVKLEYRHWDLDEEKEVPVLSATSYEGGGQTGSNVYPVHDFILECQIEVVSAGEGSLFACRLFDGADAVAADVSVGARKAGQVHLSHDRLAGLASAAGIALEPGRRYNFAMAFVDRRATLVIDGSVIAEADLPPAAKRGGVRRPLQLGARGCKLVVRDLKLSRDIHYTKAGVHGTREPARLGPDEYFLLGDNSANSQDSREWTTPGVPKHAFIGKPFLVHQPLRLGRMTFGGREQVFQTVDWSRLRWLH
jgi:signal peptidase I